jgi:hypothetical protein
VIVAVFPDSVRDGNGQHQALAFSFARPTTLPRIRCVFRRRASGTRGSRSSCTATGKV